MNKTPLKWIEQQAIESCFSIELQDMGDYRDRIDAFLERHLYSRDLAQDLVLVIDEALTNIALHSYGDVDDRVVTLRVTLEAANGGPESLLTLMLKDRGPNGASYRPSEQVAWTRARLESGEATGLGVLLMHQIMDEVKYSVTKSYENSLILRKWFCNGPSDPDYLHRLVVRLQMQNVIPEIDPGLVDRMHREHPALESEALVAKIGTLVGTDSRTIKRALIQARLVDLS